MQFSNPRRTAVIENWPSGGKRVTATFEIEATPKKGERAVRTTTGKPQKTTYSNKMVIADGDDGRTYVLAYNSMGCVQVIPGTLKTCEYFWRDGDKAAEFEQIKAVIDSVQ